MITLKCEKCGATLTVRSENTEAWHGTCPLKTPRGQVPEYKKVNNG